MYRLLTWLSYCSVVLSVFQQEAVTYKQTASSTWHLLSVCRRCLPFSFPSCSWLSPWGLWVEAVCCSGVWTASRREIWEPAGGLQLSDPPTDPLPVSKGWSLIWKHSCQIKCVARSLNSSFSVFVLVLSLSLVILWWILVYLRLGLVSLWWFQYSFMVLRLLMLV